MVKIQSILLFTALTAALFQGCVISTAQSVVEGTYDVAAFTVNNRATRALKDSALYVGEETLDYATDSDGLIQDGYTLGKGLVGIFAYLIKEAGKEWGTDVKQPEAKKYVKYTQNYKSRAEVDFDKGIVTVETVDTEESLKKAIVTTILTPEDPRGVDLYSAKEIDLKGKPHLAGMIKDHQDKVVLYRWRAENYATYLLKNSLKTKSITNNEKEKKVYFVQFPLVKGHSDIRAKKYETIVKKYARRYNIDSSLIFAIMKTESDFNPYAVSRVPAYGLMQIVPKTAGRDSHQAIHKTSGTPTKDTLFQPEKNIEYGTAYLSILYNRYLKDVRNPVSKEYCVISAYNTGSGNVLRTFHKNRTTAYGKINGLKPSAVYWKLKTQLPYDETRRYLQKVTAAKKHFVSL